MLNNDEIVTSVREESDPVDDETDEDEDNNNESSKGPSNADAFSALETAMESSSPFSGACGSPVVKVSDHGRHVTSSSTVPLKTRHLGARCTLNLPRAQASYRWYGVVVRIRGASLGVVLVT
ncbi:hypothetical protein TNCV_173061 [Trichonephila clavipes]|nr:hypothetical protein TNCV_173061 [Trichonephila clavipes]